MTTQSEKLKQRFANSKRVTVREADPDAPVTIMVGGRPAKTPEGAEKETPAKEE